MQLQECYWIWDQSVVFNLKGCPTIEHPFFIPFTKMNKSKEKILKKERSMSPTRHHILNRCRTDLFNNLSDKKNVVTLPEVYHFNHHISQKNNAPHETLHFYRFFTQVMSPKAAEIYQALLKMSLEEFYDQRFLKDQYNH